MADLTSSARGIGFDDCWRKLSEITDDGTERSVSTCIMFSSVTGLFGCGTREERNSVIILPYYADRDPD